MPSWGEILTELKDLRAKGHPTPFDEVRRRFVSLLNIHTKRDVILYASKWTQGGVPPDLISISEEDLTGFMEVMRELRGPALDLIVHSPGGSAEATEPIVKLLRSKFSDVRVIVPHAAMSAATMLACSANRISMGAQSSIGPIDPQIVLDTQLGIQLIPAQTIIDQFRMAQSEIKDEKAFGSWIPILPQYGPALLVQCNHAITLAKELVATWLAAYMLSGYPDAKERVQRIASSLGEFGAFRSHRRHIDRDQARAIGLVIENLETDNVFEDLVLSAYYSTLITLDATPAVKIIENHLGRAFVKQFRPVMVAQPMPSPPSPSPPAAPEKPKS